MGNIVGRTGTSDSGVDPDKFYKIAKTYDYLNVIKNIEKFIETVEGLSDTIHELYNVTNEVKVLNERVAELSNQIDDLRNKVNAGVGDEPSLPVEAQKSNAYKANNGF